MGCGSSKDLPIEIHEGVTPTVKSEEEIQPPQPASDSDNSPDHSSASIPSPPDLTKQNGTSNLDQFQENLTSDEEPETRPTSKSDSRKGEAIAFEVMDNSLIRKHPPKKFQKLEDLQMGTNLTPEELEMKQEIARKRRQNIINKRVQSAKERSAKSAHIRSTTEDNNEDDTGAIESPEDM